MKSVLFRELENFFDRMILPALMVLLVIVIADLFFTGYKYQYETYFLMADLAVLLVFIGDLSFKFRRAASWEGFLKEEWLEIIAVMPFFWIFRIIEGVVRLGELAQEVLHLIARSGRFVRLFAAFNIATGARDQRFRNFLKRLTGSERFDDASRFYRHPDDE